VDRESRSRLDKSGYEKETTVENKIDESDLFSRNRGGVIHP
jgi:hypothetical protein